MAFRYTPKADEALRVKEMVILPSLVRLSEHPKADGACDTGPLVKHPAGWYIEYRIVGGSKEQYRGFFLFEEVTGPAHIS